MSGRRIKSGGLRIKRHAPLSFHFEGRVYQGCAGDTLASALIANGIKIVGRSFKYHRPRGVFAAGAEEPNALMQWEEGACATPNVPATQIELYEGLSARAVNCWPNVRFDLGAVNDGLGRFLPAGFYYKTFFWPGWKFYEPFIRRAAGLAQAPKHADPDNYGVRFAHCDVLIVGAGPAGLAAARQAAAAGARVMLIEQEPVLGGALRWRGGEIDGEDAQAWIAAVDTELRAAPHADVLTRTSALGYFDHNSLVLVQSVSEHLGPVATKDRPRQRLWHVRAKEVILACGAIERPLVFCGNDRPGVMLASAVEQYIADFAVRAGDAAVFVTNNDSAYASAAAFARAGGRIAAFIDTRRDASGDASLLKQHVARFINGGVITAVKGAGGAHSVEIAGGDGVRYSIRADLVAVSGGWTPSIHLHCQSGAVAKWDEQYACLVPGAPTQREISIGACAGVFYLDAALRQGDAAGRTAAVAAGYTPSRLCAPEAVATVAFEIEPCWIMPGRGKAFVDLQNDVTAADVALAERENYVSVEHLKRYTALGMGTDQGKTSNVNALGLMSVLRGQDAHASGVTRYRFPYKPVAFGAFAGFDRGEIFRPRRRLTLHARHAAHGAQFEEYGGWARPAHYMRPGETPTHAEQREALIVRTGVGLFDASPLGKIEVLGAGASAFLDRIYANRMSDLKVGKCRYGLMLNELGVVIDDGVCARLGPDHFLVGVTSAGAHRIAAWLEEWLQCEWPHEEVIVAPVSAAFDVLTLSGPKARDVLDRLGPDFGADASSFPHLSWRAGQVGGVKTRVLRASYTGEVSFELNVAPAYSEELWFKCMEAGRAFAIAPIGVDAWMVLRTERGFLHVGADTDGTTTALDVGWERILKRKDDFIGRRSLMRAAEQRADRLNFVGVEPLNGGESIRVGLPVLAKTGPNRTEGFITSAAHSPVLRRFIGLGLVENGRNRIGEVIALQGDAGPIGARITAPGAFDPDGERVHG